ncbi:MAG TPA: EamA family transporter [Methanothrix sp.]|nr:EamA family transporter [Methanothrix sp.]HOK58252.1 EamA family transporter [Methanothrix sp.]HOL43576.1 EamA family transporter [Methanothrix sp.]HPO89135.1 EamA family transporter [Methanothrix sp.]
MNAIIIIIVSVVFAALGQLCWKLGINQAGTLTLSSLPSLLLNLLVVIGFLMYGMSTIFWLVALSKKDLSFVYPFISLTYVLVLVLSSFVLKEEIGINKLIGTVIIISGLIIIARS